MGSYYAKPVWICATFKSKGKAICPSKQIPEDILMTAAAEVLGLIEFDENVFASKIKEIQVPEVDKLIFVFFSGDVVTKSWSNRSRTWSLEKRLQAQQLQFDIAGRRKE